MHDVLQRILVSGAVEEHEHQEKGREDCRQIIMALVEEYIDSLSLSLHSDNKTCLIKPLKVYWIML